MSTYGYAFERLRDELAERLLPHEATLRQALRSWPEDKIRQDICANERYLARFLSLSPAKAAKHLSSLTENERIFVLFYAWQLADLAVKRYNLAPLSHRKEYRTALADVGLSSLQIRMLEFPTWPFKSSTPFGTEVSPS
jgi:hypothetical protein